MFHVSSGKKKAWTEGEKFAVEKHFSQHIVMQKLPGKREIEQCMARERALKDRSWTNVKDYIRNKIMKRKTRKF